MSVNAEKKARCRRNVHKDPGDEWSPSSEYQHATDTQGKLANEKMKSCLHLPIPDARDGGDGVIVSGLCEVPFAEYPTPLAPAHSSSRHSAAPDTCSDAH